MIPAVLVLSLLALLVATDAEPAGSPVHPAPEPPLRPNRNRPAGDKVAASDQMAA